MRVSTQIAVLACAVHSVYAATSAKEVGTLVASQVKSTIANDAAGVIKAFSSTLPSDVLSLVDKALNITVLQNLSGVTNATQLDSLSTMVQNKMDEIEATVHTGITNSSFYGQDQGANYNDLRSCIAQVVAQAGTASGQRCLTMNNTAAVSDIKQIFKNMVDQYAFQMPMNTALALQSIVNNHLANSSLIPAAQDLVKDVQAATLSVAATTNGEYVEAVYAAETCFFEALAQPVYTKAFEYQCNAGTLDDDDSTLDNVGDIYRATVNQYAGVLPPEIVEDIQKIGDSYLSANISKADNQTRNDVNAAILSVVASTSGNTATLTYQLLDCLDLVLIPGAGNKTTQDQCINSPTGVAASRLNIINGYIQQFFGVLPPKLILDMKNSVTASLANDTSMNAQKAKKHLDDLFTASGAGPAFVSCYESFESCTVNALGNATASSKCVLGSACKSVPFQLTAVNTTSPYSAAVSAIDKAQADGSAKEAQRIAAYTAAAKAARQQVKVVRVQVRPAKRVSKKIGKAKTLKPSSKKPVAVTVKKPKSKKPVAKVSTNKTKGKASTSKNGSLRAQKAKAAPLKSPAAKSKAKTSSLESGKISSKSTSKDHVHFTHKGGMHKTPSHKNAVKKVGQLFCFEG